MSKINSQHLDMLDDKMLPIRDNYISYNASETGYDIEANNLLNYVDTTSGAVALRLPSIADWKGKFMYFERTGTGTNALILVCECNDAANYATIEALSLDAAGDHVLLFSTGRRILVVVNGISG